MRKPATPFVVAPKTRIDRFVDELEGDPELGQFAGYARAGLAKVADDVDGAIATMDRIVAAWVACK